MQKKIKFKNLSLVLTIMVMGCSLTSCSKEGASVNLEEIMMDQDNLVTLDDSIQLISSDLVTSGNTSNEDIVTNMIETEKYVKIASKLEKLNIHDYVTVLHKKELEEDIKEQKDYTVHDSNEIMDRITRFSEIKEDVGNDSPGTQNIEFSYLVSDLYTDFCLVNHYLFSEASQNVSDYGNVLAKAIFLEAAGMDPSNYVYITLPNSSLGTEFDVVFYDEQSDNQYSIHAKKGTILNSVIEETFELQNHISSDSLFHGEYDETNIKMLDDAIETYKTALFSTYQLNEQDQVITDEYADTIFKIFTKEKHQ